MCMFLTGFTTNGECASKVDRGRVRAKYARMGKKRMLGMLTPTYEWHMSGSLVI